MQPPAMPHDEPQRLSTLREHRILDTEADAAFDAIVRLTSEILGCRISLVSLVDSDRQWFKARTGLDAEQTARDVSFCGHVVADGAPLVVGNAHLDARFADNPLVLGEPHVVAYAGVPLRASNGHVLGTLCAIDSEPRVFSDGQQAALRVLADQVERLLQLRVVTAQLEAERRECAQYERFFNLSLDPICTLDDDLRFLKVNTAWESSVGYAIDQLRNTLLDLIHPDDRAVASQHLSRLRSGEVNSVRFDTRLRCNYGGEARLSWRIVRNDGVFFATGHDITIEHRRELALLASREQLRTLFDEMEEGVVLQAGAGEIIENNPAAERLLGLSADQLLGRSSIDERWHCIHPDGSPFPGQEHPSMVVLRTLEPVSKVVMGVHKPDGELTWLLVNSRPVHQPGAEPMALTTFQDITEEIRARDLSRQLAGQERLSTTAKLASGLGAEINSPLTSILTNAEQALRDIEGVRDDSLFEVLRDIRSGAERIRCIVGSLSVLDGDIDSARRVPVDVAAVMQTAIATAQQEVRRKASISTMFEATPRVLADEAMLTQVCVCLLVSAAHHFERDDPVNNRIGISIAAGDDHVRIRVVDNGSAAGGMMLPHMFAGAPINDGDDFGLPGAHFGLAVARALVVSCGGALEGNTTASGGIELEVRLPLP